ncbi:MAG TPA: hypothetical protein VGZ22_12160, partial [Isosphaeraceae bacterium]|nr:hypothetical protein [Isosphaeraceae bacterium]
MSAAWIARVATVFVVAGCVETTCLAQTVVDADFSKGGFTALGWKVKGDWDVFTYPKAAHNPGAVARFAANKPNGSLTRAFGELKNPRKLTLSLDYGWGWGDAGQAADSVAFMLLDARGNGYVFEVHRCKARWAVQWGKVANGTPAADKVRAAEEIDASHKSVRDGGGLSHLTIARESDGAWTISSKDWNKGSGATVRFTDVSTNSFSQLVLLGTQNFDEQVFNKVVLATATRELAAATAIPAADFLNSIGVVSTFPDRGQPLPKTIAMIKYGGFRWVRGGIEGLTTQGPTTVQTYLDLHRQTGVRFSWGLVSGGTELKKLLESARLLAAADALLAFEGNNEPNNWGVTY